MSIGPEDIKLDYISIHEARAMSGLRMIVGAFAIPAPWHESCKNIYRIKGLDFTMVQSSNEGCSDLELGMNNSQSELYDWTSQSSAPVVIWNDERPRSLWNDQLFLAERLSAEPPLVSANTDERIRMFGLANELLGEDGLLFNKRHFMVGPMIDTLPDDSPMRGLWEALGQKYGYSEAALARAEDRVVDILNTMDAQLAAQQAAGKRYLIGDQLSALDIYWASGCGFLDPMPDDRCPMFTDFRTPLLYGCPTEAIDNALTPALRQHRDFIYEQHLQLPMVF